MCDVCAALNAMRETLPYEDKEGKNWYILALGEGAESKGKFQIRRDGFLWQDKWIESDNLSDAMSDLGADINGEDRSEKNWKFFQECIESLGVQNDEPS